MILTLVSDHVCLQQFLPLEPLQSPSPSHWDASPGWMQLHPAYGYCQPGDESYLTCFTQSTSYVFSVTWTMVGHSSALLLLRHCWLFIRQTKAYKAGAGEKREADITEKVSCSNGLFTTSKASVTMESCVFLHVTCLLVYQQKPHYFTVHKNELWLNSALNRDSASLSSL